MRMGRVKAASATSMTAAETRDRVARLVSTMTGLAVAVIVPPGMADGAT